MTIITSPCPAREQVQILLDGSPVKLPPGDRSVNGVRCYLESLALQRQRILFSFKVDDICVNLDKPEFRDRFSKVEGVTIDPTQMPLHLVCLAREQANRAIDETLRASDALAASDGCVAREFWWNLILALRQPLLTLNLVPEAACGIAQTGASALLLRKWQLEQLGAIIRDVDEACWSEDVNVLRNALWKRVLPWLNNLESSLDLLRETLVSAAVFRAN